jgi:hypothetical protein
VIQLDLDVRDIRQRRARGDQPCNGGAINDGCVGKNKVIRCLGLNRVCGTGLLRPRTKLAIRAAGTEGKNDLVISPVSFSLSRSDNDRLMTVRLLRTRTHTLLDAEQLKVRWRTLYATEAPPHFSHDLLMRAVAYRLQERAIGGLRLATRRIFQRQPPLRARGDHLRSYGAEA